MRRRELLSAVGGGLSLSLVGCAERGTETPDGEWVLTGRVVNEDSAPREWRVECRSRDRESVAAAFATIPGGESWAFELSGRLFDEQREVTAESDRGSVTEPWRPTDCRRLFAAITVSDGRPRIDTDCRADSSTTAELIARRPDTRSSDETRRNSLSRRTERRDDGS